MAYIGNSPTSTAFITDTFSGNASTTVFAPLSRAPAGTASIAVFVSGSYQAPGTYTLSGTTITFSSPPASGVGNIIVLHLGTGSSTQVPSSGSVTISTLSNDTYTYINAAFTQANTPSYVANSTASYANSGFAVANSAAGYANSAFTKANNSSVSITDDTTTNNVTYPLFANVTSGSITTEFISSTKYRYNPSTGELTAPVPIANNGIVINNATVGTSYTIGSGYNGMSVGPVTLANGVSITVASNQRWLVL